MSKAAIYYTWEPGLVMFTLWGSCKSKAGCVSSTAMNVPLKEQNVSVPVAWTITPAVFKGHGEDIQE